jgi:hypothetical protein
MKVAVEKVEWVAEKHSLPGIELCDHGDEHGEQVLVNMDIWNMLMATYNRTKRTTSDLALLAKYEQQQPKN